MPPRRASAAPLLLAAAAALLLAAPALAQRRKPAATPPTLTLVGHDAGGIEVRVCAGASGTPKGFSVQWMLESNYIISGNAFPAKAKDSSICMAAFTGPSYALAPSACMNVVIGEEFYVKNPAIRMSPAPGASVLACPGRLAVNELWRLRASAETLKRKNKYKAPSEVLFATTLACVHNNVAGGFKCAATEDCRLTVLDRECVCKPAAQGYYEEGGVCKGPLPPTCKRANGQNWCWEESQCGDNCNAVCDRLYMGLNATNAAWFEAQNTPEKCVAISEALGLGSTVGPMATVTTTLKCAQSAVGAQVGALNGPITCASDPGCPARARVALPQDLGGFPCNDAGASRRMICPCELVA